MPKNHRIDCKCFICKAKRHEPLKKETCLKISKARKKFLLKNPEKHNFYKHGLSLIKKYCINCNKEVDWRNQGGRCIKCSNQYKNKIQKKPNVSGKNNPFYGHKHTIQTKKRLSLTHGGTGIPGEKNEYGAEFDNVLKEQVRFRDKYKCQLCGCSQLENGRQLDVHHIDYNKKNNKLQNLISLCHSCHVKTNSNREYWKKYYRKGNKNVRI